MTSATMTSSLLLSRHCRNVAATQPPAPSSWCVHVCVPAFVCNVYVFVSLCVCAYVRVFCIWYCVRICVCFMCCIFVYLLVCLSVRAAVCVGVDLSHPAIHKNLTIPTYFICIGFAPPFPPSLPSTVLHTTFKFTLARFDLNLDAMRNVPRVFTNRDCHRHNSIAPLLNPSDADTAATTRLRDNNYPAQHLPEAKRIRDLAASPANISPGSSRPSTPDGRGAHSPVAATGPSESPITIGGGSHTENIRARAEALGKGRHGKSNLSPPKDVSKPPPQVPSRSHNPFPLVS